MSKIFSPYVGTDRAIFEYALNSPAPVEAPVARKPFTGRRDIVNIYVSFRRGFPRVHMYRSIDCSMLPKGGWRLVMFGKEVFTRYQKIPVPVRNPRPSDVRGKLKARGAL